MKCFDYRRREVLKTTAVVCGVALGLGAIGVPFFLKKGSPPAELLLSPEIAKADPELFRQVCLLYHRHPDDRVRSACVSYLGGFDDAAVRAALWQAAEADRTVGVRGEATAALPRRG